MFNFQPREKKTARTEQVNTTVEPSLKTALATAAEELGVTTATVAYEALQGWIKAYNEARSHRTCVDCDKAFSAVNPASTVCIDCLNIDRP